VIDKNKSTWQYADDHDFGLKAAPLQLQEDNFAEE